MLFLLSIRSLWDAPWCGHIHLRHSELPSSGTTCDTVTVTWLAVRTVQSRPRERALSCFPRWKISVSDTLDSPFLPCPHVLPSVTSRQPHPGSRTYLGSGPHSPFPLCPCSSEAPHPARVLLDRLSASLHTRVLPHLHPAPPGGEVSEAHTHGATCLVTSCSWVPLPMGWLYPTAHLQGLQMESTHGVQPAAPTRPTRVCVPLNTQLLCSQRPHRLSPASPTSVGQLHPPNSVLPPLCLSLLCLTVKSEKGMHLQAAVFKLGTQFATILVVCVNLQKRAAFPLYRERMAQCCWKDCEGDRYGKSILHTGPHPSRAWRLSPAIITQTPFLSPCE